MSWHPTWPEERCAALRFHVLGGHLSYSGIAAAINNEFGTHYSRNAAIGKAGRMKLINPYWQKMAAMPKKPRKPQPYKPRPKRPMSIQSHEYVELECSEIVPERVDIVACDGCRWPYGEGPFTFCNHKKIIYLNSNGDEIESSYCGPHQRLSERRNG